MADENPLVALTDARADAGRAVLTPGTGSEDFRDTPEFEKLETEFRKMEIDGPAAVNWKKLNADTLEVLRSRSKDLVLGTRLTYGLFVDEGYLGLAVGMTVLRDMARDHWDDMVPPVKRERGRAGAYDWLAEKLGPLVEGRAPPDDGAKGNLLIAHDALNDLDGDLEQKLQKFPAALGPLIRALRPYARDIRAALEEARRTREAAAAASDDQQPPGSPAQAAVSPEAGPAEAAPAQPAPTAQSAAPNVAAAPAAPEIVLDDGNMEGTLRSIFNAASKAATSIRQQAPIDPRGYYAARFAQWGRVQALPPETGGRTALPPPQKAKLAELAALQAAGNHDGLVQAAESTFAASPFWLDAQFVLAQAFTALGEPYDAARRLVIGELASFLIRFPELPSLSFNDGTAFASADARSWIGREVLAGGGGGEAVSELDSILSEASKLAQSGKTLDGLACLRQYVSSCRAERDWFVAQLKIADYCLRFDLMQPVYALLSRLRTIAEEKQIAAWEPDVAVELARLSWQSLGNKNVKQFVSDADVIQLRAEVMGALSTLDLAVAAELTAKR